MNETIIILLFNFKRKKEKERNKQTKREHTHVNSKYGNASQFVASMLSMASIRECGIMNSSL